MPELSNVHATMVTVPVNVEVNEPSLAVLMTACSMPLPVPWITGASTATKAGQPVACGLGTPTSGAEVPDGVLFPTPYDWVAPGFIPARRSYAGIRPRIMATAAGTVR